MFLENFKKNGKTFLDDQSLENITNFLRKANDYYYNKGSSLLKDEEYDIIKEYIEDKYPDAEILQEVGAPIEENDKTKVKLPFQMPSMNKIRPDSTSLKNWLKKYTKPSQYLVSVKLYFKKIIYEYLNYATIKKKFQSNKICFNKNKCN